MNYEDVKQSTDWVSMMNKAYIENIGGVPVFIYKLDRTNTKMDPLYGEEINGRNYLRPFEMKALMLINPYEFMFSDNLISNSEADGKSFHFNFDTMVQKIHSLKRDPLSVLSIKGSGSWAIEKKNNVIYLYRNNVIVDRISLTEFRTISSVGGKIASHGVIVNINDNDDYSLNLRNFSKIDFSGSELVLKTYNKEYENVTDVIGEGDLILELDTVRLYEVTSSRQTGNYGWKYQMWETKCDKSYPYVEYDVLKAQIYGIKSGKVKIK